MSDLPSSGVAATPPAPPTPPGGPLFSVYLSFIYALVILALTVPGLLAAPSRSPIELLRQPEDSLERLVTRQMELREAVRAAPPWQRALTALFASSDPGSEAADWFDEAAGAFGSPIAQLYREVLTREADRAARGDDPPAAPEAPADAEAEPLAGHMREWLRAAYPPPGEAPLDVERAAAILREIRELAPPGWLADTLVARVAEGAGNAAARAEAEGAIAARGRVLLGRAMALAASNVLFALVGIALLVASRGQLQAIGAAPIPPPWLVRDGLGLFVRGAAAYLILASLTGLFIPADTLAEPFTAMAAGLPMLLLTQRCLAAYGISLPRTFGLRISPGRAGTLAATASVLVALSVAAAVLIALGASALGVSSHWADGFPEEILWAPPGVAALHIADTVIWTPFIEELAFRGILYGTLRRRLPVWPAALVSAGVFAAAHGYGVIGFASVLVSGLLWTLAYEGTRSLLPGIVAHGVNNLIVAVDMLALLRL
jgi:hypothetical protein